MEEEEIHKVESMIISTYFGKFIVLPQFILGVKLFKTFVWEWNINVISKRKQKVLYYLNNVKWNWSKCFK